MGAVTAALVAAALVVGVAAQAPPTPHLVLKYLSAPQWQSRRVGVEALRKHPAWLRDPAIRAALMTINRREAKDGTANRLGEDMGYQDYRSDLARELLAAAKDEPRAYWSVIAWTGFDGSSPIGFALAAESAAFPYVLLALRLRPGGHLDPDLYTVLGNMMALSRGCTLPAYPWEHPPSPATARGRLTAVQYARGHGVLRLAVRAGNTWALEALALQGFRSDRPALRAGLARLVAASAEGSLKEAWGNQQYYARVLAWEMESAARRCPPRQEQLYWPQQHYKPMPPGWHPPRH